MTDLLCKYNLFSNRNVFFISYTSVNKQTKMSHSFILQMYIIKCSLFTNYIKILFTISSFKIIKNKTKSKTNKIFFHLLVTIFFINLYVFILQ